MSQNTISLLQAIGITVQIINAGAAAVIHNPLVALIVSAVAGGYQYYVQKLGNESQPPPPPAAKSAGAGQ